jgi:hypothetical protein
MEEESVVIDDTDDTSESQLSDLTEFRVRNEKTHSIKSGQEGAREVRARGLSSVGSQKATS